METTVKLYSLNFRQAKTYWFTLLFVAGNLILPQLCHLIPQGGLILLPIYFFTLIAAYKFGIRVGLLTAVLSPLGEQRAVRDARCRRTARDPDQIGHAGP